MAEQAGERESNGDESEGEWAGRIDHTLWEAMGELAAISQFTVGQSGVMLRLEAVKSEIDQQQFQPLRPYQEVASIKHHCRPWQQMLMFFIRTQRPHDWSSPAYQFNRRQTTASGKLIEVAGEPLQFESEEAGDSTMSSIEGNSSDNEDDDNHDRLPDDRPQMKSIHQACLTFCIESLNQTIHNKEYDMAMVCATADLGVHAQHGFRAPESYPPILSLIVKIARFTIIQQAEEVARPGEPDGRYSLGGGPMHFEHGSDSGYESEEQSPTRSHRAQHRPARVQHATSFQWVRDMVWGFMARGTAGPMQWLLDLRTYGLKIHYNTTAIGHVDWRDKYALGYKDIRFTMGQFCGIVHQLIHDTRQAILEDIVFVSKAEEVPAIPWHQLYDDPSNRSMGWSWIRDQRTQLPTDGQEWLYARIQSREDLQDRFVSHDSEGGYHHERVRDFMRQVARFRALMLVLMHITGGQPARGPEILSCRHHNTAAGRHHNVVIEDGQVVFVTKYHKSVQISGDVKIIHRYLPRGW